MEKNVIIVALMDNTKQYVKETASGKMQLVDIIKNATIYNFKNLSSIYSDNSVYSYLKNKNKDIDFRIQFVY